MMAAAALLERRPEPIMPCSRGRKKAGITTQKWIYEKFYDPPYARPPGIPMIHLTIWTLSWRPSVPSDDLQRESGAIALLCRSDS